jgi:membrane-associated phospholipid phosphatase
LPYLFFLILGGSILVSFSKIDIHWFINQYNNKIADFFFKYFTDLGDGVISALAIIVLLFVRYRYTLAMILSTFLSTLIVRLFKQLLLPDFDRPVLIFQKINHLHLVPGVDMHTINSFPSGHSATAFSVYLLLAMITENKFTKLLLFTVAFLVAYSRIYLSQHFFVDIYFGSLIGAFASILSFFWTLQWKNPRWDLSLLNKMNKKDGSIKE